MSWTLGSVVIHPGDKQYRRNKTANYAMQDVLDATAEVVSFYGAKSRRSTLNFILFEAENSSTGLNTLEGYVGTDADVALASDQGAEGNFRILTLDASRVMDTSRSTPVWDCVASLIKV
jgi:hypothetical protein